MYKVFIADIAELAEEVTSVEIGYANPESDLISSLLKNTEATIAVLGRVSFDFSKRFMLDSTKAIADWSLLSPGHDDVYKTVIIEITNAGETQKYEFSNVFVISYLEQFDEQGGFFKLVMNLVRPIEVVIGGDAESPPDMKSDDDEERDNQRREIDTYTTIIKDESNQFKGNFGEMSADIDVESKGPIDPKTSEPKVPHVTATRVGDSRVTGIDDSGHQGIDGIYKCDPPPPAFIIVEAKYGKSNLGKTYADRNDKSKGKVKQMSDPWILGGDRIDKYFAIDSKDPIDRKKAAKEMQEFRLAWKKGLVQKELAKVDAQGNVTRTLL